MITNLQKWAIVGSLGIKSDIKERKFHKPGTTDDLKLKKKKKTKLRGRIPQANYTDRATAACRRSFFFFFFFYLFGL
jgi:hypothetical protein